jgi:predicted amidohydrolase
MVIAPTCWLGSDGADVGMAHDPDCEVKFLDSLIVARAFENECVVVFVNCGGKTEEGWIGGSGVTVPFKGWVKKAVSRFSRPFSLLLSLH